MSTAQERRAQRAATKVNEALWQDKVVAYARLNGWWVYHTYDSRKSSEGFPDLVLIRPPRLVFAELKGDGGHLTREQRHVLGMLDLTTAEVHTWWPRDWDAVQTVLGRPHLTD